MARARWLAFLQLVLLSLLAAPATFAALPTGASEAWTPIALAEREEVPEIYASPDPAIFYGRRSGLESPLFRSTDGGLTWEARPSPPSWRGLAVVDPLDADTVYLSDPGQLYRSGDGGRTWTSVLAGDGAVTVLPSRHRQVVYAAGAGRFWRSFDGGHSFTWRRSLPSPEYTFSGLAETVTGVLYLFRQESIAGNGGRLYRSDDQGLNWHLERSVLTDWSGWALVAHPQLLGTVYLIYDHIHLLRTTDGDVEGTDVLLPDYFTNDSGRLHLEVSDQQEEAESVWLFAQGHFYVNGTRGRGTWVELDPAGQGYVHRAAFTPGGQILAAGPEQWQRSTDYGLHFQALPAAGLPADVRLLPTAEPGTFYANGRHHLYRTEDDGLTWTIRNEAGLDLLGVDPFDPEILYARFFPTLKRSLDGGVHFDPLATPVEPMQDFLAFAESGATSFVATAPDGRVWRKAAAAADWSAVDTPFALRSPRFDPGSQVLYALTLAELRLVHSLDFGRTWSEGANLAEPHYAVGAGKVAAYDNLAVAISYDHGVTFTRRSLLADFAPEALTMDTQGTLYLVGPYQIWRSRNDGATWQALARDLPIAVAHGLAFDPNDHDRLLAATEAGLYRGTFRDGDSLSLHNGRFRATLSWRDPGGQTGVGHAMQLTEDSGGFWLFSPDRAEVVVKLLDGRAIGGHYWVFVASQSNVEFDLDVVDTVKGEARHYHNPQSTMASFGDTAAFPLGAAEPAAAAIPWPRAALNGRGSWVDLQNGRFRVSVDWITDAGAGIGYGAQVAGETAAFSFFSDANIELLINVIDGRPLNGRYWVFFGSLSNVDYTLYVHDLQEDLLRVYHNPAGTFASVADTEAFPSRETQGSHDNVESCRAGGSR